MIDDTRAGTHAGPPPSVSSLAPQAAGPEPVEEILQRIHADLRDDGVYVDPALEAAVTPAQLDAIVDNVAASEVPVRVVLYPLAEGDPFAGKSADLLARLHDAYPEPGTYLSTTTQLEATSYSGVDLEGRSYDVPGVADGDLVVTDALRVLRYEDLTSAGAAAQRATELLNAPPAEVTAAYEEARSQWCETHEGACGATGGPDGEAGPTPGVLAVVVVSVVVLGAVAWAGVRAWGARLGSGPDTRRAPVPAARPEEPFVLPASAMARVRDAHDRRLEQDTRDELLALGEAVDEAEIGPRHDQAAWEAALDHYEAARAALARSEEDAGSEGRPAVLDVVGALVLARRGREALRAALRGRAWAPVTACYLNPLHGAARTRHPVATAADGRGASSHPEGAGRREVPVCAACRTDLSAGREPDVLDVVQHGRPRHYFETDVEPWASTGYGSLEPDLVSALRRDAG